MTNKVPLSRHADEDADGRRDEGSVVLADRGQVCDGRLQPSSAAERQQGSDKAQVSQRQRRRYVNPLESHMKVTSTQAWAITP